METKFTKRVNPSPHKTQEIGNYVIEESEANCSIFLDSEKVKTFTYENSHCIPFLFLAKKWIENIEKRRLPINVKGIDVLDVTHVKLGSFLFLYRLELDGNEDENKQFLFENYFSANNTFAIAQEIHKVIYGDYARCKSEKDKVSFTELLNQMYKNDKNYHRNRKLYFEFYRFCRNNKIASDHQDIRRLCKKFYPFGKPQYLMLEIEEKRGIEKLQLYAKAQKPFKKKRAYYEDEFEIDDCALHLGTDL